jgi:hypothetical protein
MRPDDQTLTAEERAALVAIEDALARPPAATDAAAAADLAALTALVRRSAPQADPAYRLRLRARVRAEAARQRPPARLITRRRLLVAGLAAATVGGATLAAPHARAALGGLLGLAPPPPTTAPLAVERAMPLPFAVGGSRPGWQGPDNAQREYYLHTLLQERWALNARFGTRAAPPAGSIVALSGGRPLPIPGYLPADFEWQGIMVSDGGPPNTIPYEYIGQGGGGGGGGGSGLPWERPLRYDHRVAAYLIGGDPTDRFLILQQLRPDPQRGVIVSAFQMDVPPQASPRANAPSGSSGQRTALVILVEPARDYAGLAVQVGPNALHATTVGGATAWWFGGQWDATGQWIDDGRWISLVWSRDGDIYCLSGQDLGLTEVLRVAESLPPLP